MSPIVLRGLTWDHPRAYQGLEAETDLFNAMESGVVLGWERHGLRQFEAAPLDQLAAQYDLIIFDHPFVGDVAATGALLDLGPYAETIDLRGIEADALGPSYRSYEYGGVQWAVPVDAACQTAVYRPDLLERWNEDVPQTLSQVLGFAERRPIALALAVPHAFMNHLSLCALMGAEINGEEDFLDLAISCEAIDIQRRLVRHVPAAAANWSSIATLDAMAGSQTLAYCPLVFCFNTYSRSDRSLKGKRLRFSSPPLCASQPQLGPVAGGAGLAISAHCRFPNAAVTALSHLMRPDSHRRMAIAGGQVGRASAWSDQEADLANGGFFGACRQAMDDARIRPRHRGYVELQNEAGALLRSAMINPTHSNRWVAERLNDLYARYGLPGH